MKIFPTLMIGLGLSGRIVLRRLKNNLAGFRDQEAAEPIKLLWMGVPCSDAFDNELPIDLDPDERIDLNADPHFLNLNVQDPEIIKNFPWFTEVHQPDTGLRVDGRMSYFWERQFNPNSNRNQQWIERFNNYQEFLVRPPDDKFRLWIVACLTEIEAAMMFDLAYDIRHSQISERVSEIGLFLLLDNKLPGKTDSIIDNSNDKPNRFATLRELSRLVSGKKQVIDHGVYESSMSSRILFDRIYLYDQPNTVRALPDQLIALFDRNVKNRLAETNRIPANTTAGQFVFTTISSQTYLLPIEEIHKFCAARLSLEVLFGDPSEGFQNIGLFPVQQSTGQHIFPAISEDYEAVVTRLLRIPSANPLENDAFQGLISAAKGKWIVGRGESLTVNLESAFQEKLEVFLAHEMQIRSEQNRGKNAWNPVTWAAGVLAALKNMLRSSEYVILQQARRGEGTAVQLKNCLPKLLEITSVFEAEIENWANILLKQFFPTLTEDVTKAGKTLLNLSEQNPSQILVYGVSEKGQIPGEGIYRENMALRVGEKVFSDVANRIHWKWERDITGRSRLIFLFLSGDQELSEVQVTSQNCSLFLDMWRSAMYKNTEPFIRDLSISEQLKQSAHRLGSTPLRSLLDKRPIAMLGGSESSFVVAERTPFLDDWLQTSIISLGSQSLIDTKDNSRITYLQISSNLTPDQSATLYADQNAYRSHPRWHIFLQEQKAAKIEMEIDRIRRRNPEVWRGWDPIFEKGYRFHSDFVRFMFDPSAFDILMRLVFYDRFQVRKSKTGVQQWHLVPLSAKSLPISITDANTDDTLEVVFESIFFEHYQNFHDSAHPLFQNRFYSTLQDYDQELKGYWQNQPEEHDFVMRNIEIRIKGWEKADAFCESLAVYQKYLLYTTENPQTGR